MILPPYLAVVDDDDTVRKALRRALKPVRLEIRMFSSGRDFLAAITERLPEVAIFDIQMPEMTGLELQERLQAEGRSFPIIFITASDDEELRRLAMARGALGFIGKPFDRQALLDFVGVACNEAFKKPVALKLRLQSQVLDKPTHEMVDADVEQCYLKLCPFCHAYPRVEKSSWLDKRGQKCYQARVSCPNCTAEVTAEPNREFTTSITATADAVERWNRRGSVND